MAGRGHRDAKKEAHWRRHVAAQRESGLTVRGYCEERGLSQGRFFWWRREIARRDAEHGRRGARGGLEAAFAELRVVDGDPRRSPGPSAGEAAGIEVCLGGGRSVRVGRGFDEATFARVVALLEWPSPC